MENIIYKEGLFAKAFPVEAVPNKKRISETDVSKDIVEISDQFSFQFHNSGIMENGKVLTIDTIPIYEKPITLGDILENDVTNYDISDEKIEKFQYLRGPKKYYELQKPVMNIILVRVACQKLMH